MNLPITTIGAIVGAAKLVQGFGAEIANDVREGVANSLGFHEILTDQSSVEDASAGQTEAATELRDRIRQRLATAGIAMDQELTISISQTGQIQVDGQHGRAAEIESLLNSDGQISALAGRLAGTPNAAGLTIRSAQTNIARNSGGYPNW